MNRTALVKTLEQVGRALADNDLVPIMKCFLFDGTNVTASNDYLTIIAPCPTDAAFAVNGKTLLGLLSASHSEDVQFLIERYEVIVKAGKSQFKLPFFPAEDFPFKVPEIEEFDITLNMRGFEACLLTSSKDNAQPALMGVLVNGSLYSSDGDAITRYSLSTKPENQLQPYMMPNGFVETVLKLSTSDNDKTMLAPGWAMSKLGDLTVWGRLMDPPPVDLEDAINKTVGESAKFVPIPEELSHALDRARVVADPESAPTKLTVENGKLHLLTESSLGVVMDVLLIGDQRHNVTALVSAELMQRSISLTAQMTIMDNCCIFIDDEPRLFILLSNYG